MKREMLYRILFYLAGLLFLAFGLTLNTTTGLGVSAIISVSHALSVILGMQIGDTTFCLYSLFVMIELIIHYTMKRKDPSFPFKKQAVLDILQLPLSLVFTRVMNIFASFLPMLTELEDTLWSTFPLRFAALIIAIIFTGIGAAMSLDMRIIPNPGDGLVQAFSDVFKKDVGTMKNIIDLVNIVIAIIIGYLFLGRLVSVGIGTVCAVIGVGRVIHLFNGLCLEKMKRLSGLT